MPHMMEIKKRANGHDVSVPTHNGLATVFTCPVCGREFALTWPPQYSKLIIVPGDELSIHTYSSPFLSIGGFDVKTQD